MDPTFDYLLKQLNANLTEPRPVSERLITSGRHFTRWVQDRIQLDQQLLLNAIICTSSTMQDRLRTILLQIEEEFQDIATIKSLPYPYDDLDLMKQVVADLISHFKAQISTDEVIQTLTDSRNRLEERSGYIILTIINNQIIC